MKRIPSLLIVFVMLAVLVPGTAFAQTGNDGTVVDLIAGQHIDAGDIKVWNDSDNLYVKYIAATDWCLDETHLQVASSLDDIPQANGNPIPGQFDYKNTKSCVPNFTYTVPLTGDSCDLYIAAHAVVKKKNGPTETAWGSGIDFPGDNWATYFLYSVDGCIVPNPGLSLAKTADPSTYSAVGQLIAYSYVIENTGNIDLAGPFSVTDDKTPVSCEQPADGTLSPGETMNCSASYSITQADLNAGSVTNTASASGGGVTSPEVTASVTAFVPNPSLSLSKEGVLDMTVVAPSDQADLGDVINYTLTAMNNGNVTLSNVVISDPLLGTLSCSPSLPASLAPGKSVVCTGSHTLIQADISNGKVENTATVSSDQTPPVRDTNITSILQPSPHLSLVKSTTTTSYDQVGQVIDYTLVATNDGNVALTNVSISDPLIGTLNCTQPVSLAPGDSLTCTGSHTVTQADLDAGSVLNTATVSGTDPDAQSVTDGASKTVNAGNICQPTVVTADFSQIVVGDSVEGLGKVAPHLNIDAKGTAIKILEATDPMLYNGAPGGVPPIVINGGIATDGGFSDKTTQTLGQAHLYTFTFLGTTVNDFSLHMLDYGDLNPSLAESHFVSMTAYDANGNVVSKQELSYTTPGEIYPRNSNLYGDMLLAGDALAASPGQPGNWTWNVSGVGIVEVVLEFGGGFDPYIGFDTLKFTTECLACQPAAAAADFSQVAVGESVEGLGVVAPYLDIDAQGTAVRIQESTMPSAYNGRNDNPIANGGIAAGGGFSDMTARAALQAHQYTFTFAGVAISDFSLHMLDYGDWNPTLDTAHSVSLTAYDGTGTVVAQQEISYTTQAVALPRDSSLYGDLYLTGDAATASPGQPGNWTWNISGSGIVQIVLESGPGFDPAIGFDTLNFNQQCP